MFNDQAQFVAEVYEAVKIAETAGFDIGDKSQLKQKEKTTLLLEACRKSFDSLREFS